MVLFSFSRLWENLVAAVATNVDVVVDPALLDVVGIDGVGVWVEGVIAVVRCACWRVLFLVLLLMPLLL